MCKLLLVFHCNNYGLLLTEINQDIKIAAFHSPVRISH